MNEYIYIYVYTCIDLDTSICQGPLDHLLPLFNLQTARMPGFSSNFGKSIDSNFRWPDFSQMAPYPAIGKCDC